MTRTLSLLVLLAAPALAQNETSAHRISGAVRHAGIYHVATGTWTRTAGSTAALGADVIYRNDASSGYFTVANAGYGLVDEGRLPVAAGPEGATRDSYGIDCFDIAYCSDTPNLTVEYVFYDSYVPCDDVDAPANCLSPVGQVTLTGLPGGGSGSSCWSMSIDLAFSPVCLEGGGGPCSPGDDGNVLLDSFGWEQAFVSAPGTLTGPVLAGDPSWTAVAPGAAWGGGGTYYLPGETCAAGSTGLDTQDQFFATDSQGIPPGCYWFGGYVSNNGCASGPANPMASFYLTLYSEPPLPTDCCDTPCCAGVCLFDLVCDPASPHSGGQSATLGLSTLGTPLHLECTDGPPGSFGYFLVSASFTEPGLPVSNGRLCVASPIGRYSAGSALASGNPSLDSVGQFDALGVLINLAGTSATGTGFDVPPTLPNPPGGVIASGDTYTFQCWFRDGQRSNFSDALVYFFP